MCHMRSISQSTISFLKLVVEKICHKADLKLNVVAGSSSINNRLDHSTVAKLLEKENVQQSTFNFTTKSYVVMKISNF